MKISTAILVCSLIGTTPALVMGTTIASWTFESNTPADVNNSQNGPNVADESGNVNGTASGFHTSGLADWSTPGGNGSANSFSANTWAVGDYWQFQVSTVGFENISISWNQAGSGTGPRDFIVKFSTDGTSFTTVGSDYHVSLVNWSATTFQTGFTFNPDLSGIASLIADQPDVYFRLVDNSTSLISSSSYSTVQPGGTDRIDNFAVTGTEISTNVPDSISGFASLGCALGLLAVLRRISSVPIPLPQKHA